MLNLKKAALGTTTQSRTVLALFAATLLVGGTATVGVGVLVGGTTTVGLKVFVFGGAVGTAVGVPLQGTMKLMAPM